MSVVGRWVGHWFEWPCSACGEMRTALQAPADGDDRCGRCKADADYQLAMQAMAERLESERDEWRGRAKSAERDLEEARREIANLKGRAA